MGGSDTQGRSIKSVRKAFRILELLREHDGMSVTDLSVELGESKSTAHHYLSTMESEGYVSKEGGEYRLDLALLTLGGAVREREEIYRRARGDVYRLANETGEVARLIAEHDNSGIVLYQVMGDEAAEPHVPLGGREPLHCTAAGKAFLAELPTGEAERIVEATGMTTYTENTITELQTLRTELQSIRSRGVAFDDEERFDGIRCVATTVNTVSGDLIGAISVSGPTERLTDQRFEEELPRTVQNIAGAVEITSKYSTWTDEQ
ncbi:IclR family transcriptional regulator [Halorhabdus amylolytica]|uniref:IclR family transcriptional regulator n=1 Tax=Halorhabdus amylolytica TaxID=2559573 RepID=UPI0010A9F839|nr:IclR family transcriptional regulator [Halorhabdus amylolytica]